MKKLLKWYVALKTNEKGATAVEYGLIVALIAAVIVTIVATLGDTIAAKFQEVVNAIKGS